jgi:hypothetical protein
VSAVEAPPTPPVLVVTNARGRLFVVVYDDPVCPHGGRQRTVPIVCVYDATHQGDQRFPEPLRGQFVSCYRTDTLLESPHGYGLNLYGGEPKWKLDIVNVAAIREFIIDNQRGDDA